MRRLLLACLALLALAAPAAAASRFWNPYAVTGAVANGGTAKCELTLSPAVVGSGLIVGDTIIVTSIGGATGCNGTDTIASFNGVKPVLTTLVPSGAYTSGGCVAGGHVTSTNTANWAASSTATCGSGGSAVPSADSVTFDANSLGGTIIWPASYSMQTIAADNFTGTLDFATNNTALTFTSTSLGFSMSSAATHTLNCGTGTWSFAIQTGSFWSTATNSGLTISCTGMTISLTATSQTGSRTASLGGKALGALTVGALSGTGARFAIEITPGTGGSFTTATVAAPNIFKVANSGTLTLTDLTITNATSVPVYVASIAPNSAGTTITLTNAPTIGAGGVMFSGVTLTNAATWANCYDGGGNNFNGGTCTVPVHAGGGMVSN